MNQEQKITRLTFAYHFFFDKRYRGKAKDINLFLMEVIFSGFDDNHDGRLSFLEFLEGKNLFESKSRRDNMKFVFRLIDLNRNRKIEKKEIENFLDKLHKAGVGKKSNHAKFAQDMIDELDGNNDGFIDEDEFIEGFFNNAKYYEFIESIFVFETSQM